MVGTSACSLSSLSLSLSHTHTHTHTHSDWRQTWSARAPLPTFACIYRVLLPGCSPLRAARFRSQIKPLLLLLFLLLSSSSPPPPPPCLQPLSLSASPSSAMRDPVGNVAENLLVLCARNSRISRFPILLKLWRCGEPFVHLRAHARWSRCRQSMRACSRRCPQIPGSNSKSCQPSGYHLTCKGWDIRAPEGRG